MSKLSEKLLGRWLDAHRDDAAGVTTLSQCVTFCDVTGAGDRRLVLASLAAGAGPGAPPARLRTYRGQTLLGDQPLPAVPSSVLSLYTDVGEPRVPAVAVACGPEVLLYRSGKPFYKFSVPPLPPPLDGRADVVTCAAVLLRDSPNEGAVGCLVAATEAGRLFVLDPRGFGVLQQADAGCGPGSAPCHVRCSGTLAVEYRLVVACRDGRVQLLRRGWLEGRALFRTAAPLVDLQLVPDDGVVVVATRDGQLHGYDGRRGRKLWSVATGGPVACTCLVTLPHLSCALVAVGVRGGPLRLYRGRRLVDSVHVGETVTAVGFGHLGQEENVLVAVTESGSLIYKILKRTADFSVSSPADESATAPGAAACRALPLPKRSKLFAEQAQREREHTPAIHHAYQQDLIRLRLSAGAETVRALQTVDGPHSDLGRRAALKLAALVAGLGPAFTLTLVLENMSAAEAVAGVRLVFHAQRGRYTVDTPYAAVPLIPPGLSYRVETLVTDNAADEADSVPIRVFVVQMGQTQPILAATINMPITDPIAFT